MHRIYHRFRPIFLLLLGLFPVSSLSQEGSSSQSAPITPQIFVNVKEYQNGAEMVTVSSVKSGYPGDLLAQQCQAIAINAGANIRGLSIEASHLGNEAQSTIARATFATENLINRQTGALDIQPIARAFAGSPEPWGCQGIVVTFEGERPAFNTLKSLKRPEVEVTSQVLTNPDGIEYRILLKSQNSAEIIIPSLIVQNETPNPEPKKGKKMNPMVFVLLGIGAISAGALVYFAALRPGSRR